MNNKINSNTLIYKIEKEDTGIKLKEVLYDKLKLSGRLARKIKRSKNIFVNDYNISLDSSLRKGDIVKVIMPNETNNFKPQDIPIDVAYEDMDLLIINKQPNIVVHPTKGHYDNTIANGLANYLQKTGQVFKIRFINRLDMNTSGLLMIAKNPFAQQKLSDQMSKNAVEKKYLAVVRGVIKNKYGTVDVPIGLTDEDRIQRKVIKDGRRSITHYQVLDSYNDASLVRLTLETGRTHQIRVHMKYIGHPIIGDELYGYVDKELINRQALHAETLRFYQPRTGEEKLVRAEMPQDIEQLITKLKK
ncbi:RluA family pseudouridine synthase [Maledivibacter halophilus]|uniref:Pseudouridine synthase n=1 Tax=Maledivibacter halophilus TaxID=36842 RepID=A0A1T5KJL9_9FIRM|nr:RluA family pseudouridine synthase [Maledivibacter halophilus]SKC63863.1 23S rRNA pseudouridine1911/1915/1917 synthase [Maledivibacter halophilus]